MAEAPADLSAFKNKTVLQPTGEAQTTMVNKTTVPFEQTTIEGINQTQGQQQQDNQTITQGQQQQDNQTITQGQQQQDNQTITQEQQQGGQEQQQQKQGNQSSGPLEKIGETITGVFK
jgi:hypothetical protein